MRSGIYSRLTTSSHSKGEWEIIDGEISMSPTSGASPYCDNAVVDCATAREDEAALKDQSRMWNQLKINVTMEGRGDQSDKVKPLVIAEPMKAPVPPSTPQMLGVQHVHVVQPNDTLQGICLSYKISPTRLRQTNHFSGNSLLLAPSTLVIPIAESPPTTPLSILPTPNKNGNQPIDHKDFEPVIIQGTQPKVGIVEQQRDSNTICRKISLHHTDEGVVETSLPLKPKYRHPPGHEQQGQTSLQHGLSNHLAQPDSSRLFKIRVLMSEMRNLDESDATSYLKMCKWDVHQALTIAEEDAEWDSSFYESGQQIWA